MPNDAPGGTDRYAVGTRVARPSHGVDLLVVGAGEAGCAAAAEAARAGLSVLLVDENPLPPDLIGMDVPLLFGGRATAAVQRPDRLTETVLANSPGIDAAIEAGVDVRLGTMVWGAFANGENLRSLPCPIAGLADRDRAWHVGFERMVLASGARDLVVSFAGSEAPGVVGALGLRTLLTRYDAFAGRRVALLGTGPLAVATAALLAGRGIAVVAVIEAVALPIAPEIGAVLPPDCPVLTSYVPTRAIAGPDGVTGLEIVRRTDGIHRTIDCDTICLALGQVPMIELADVLGARIVRDGTRGGHVVASADGVTTSRQDLFVAGDCSGPGLDPAQSGRAAAAAVLRSLGRETPEPPVVAAGGDSVPPYYLSLWMEALLETGGPDVLACLCEEVTRGELAGVRPPRYLGTPPAAMEGRDLSRLAAQGPVNQDQIKRLTRACMGPCQARRCREQVAALLALAAGVDLETIPLAGHRAPVRPLSLSQLAADGGSHADWDVWFGIPTQWTLYEDIGTPNEALGLGRNRHL